MRTETLQRTPDKNERQQTVNNYWHEYMKLAKNLTITLKTRKLLRSESISWEVKHKSYLDCSLFKYHNYKKNDLHCAQRPSNHWSLTWGTYGSRNSQAKRSTVDDTRQKKQRFRTEAITLKLHVLVEKILKNLHILGEHSQAKIMQAGVC